ncbi:hypothetical protein MKI84_08635 [Ancylobacter sp. A5.8]|uniref:hypothetical protein n=1 Tax=Ancylobacter gelatini TaxID=2919920 RepID=UPI001F4DD2DA|nr:hypothetical protein [Ancylobacter gelatini]MCJ8142982.1 hypothetical protein [Ancylobacter gelatini]
MGVELLVVLGEVGREVRWPLGITVAPGEVVEMEVRLASGAVRLYSTARDEIRVEFDPTTIVVPIDAALQAGVGSNSVVDLYCWVGDTRSKLDAGRVRIVPAGVAATYRPMVAGESAMRGPPGYIHRGPWTAGSFTPPEAVSHLGSTWYALRATTQEPGPEATDWSMLLDGTGAAADRQAAQDAAEAAAAAANVAGPAGAAAVAAAEIIQPLAVQVGADATAVEVARGEVAGNAAAVASNKAATDAARDDAVTAAANTNANLDGGPVFITEAELLAYVPADRKPATLAVNSGSRRRGVYRRTAGAWPSTPESDTLPAVDGRTAVLETAVRVDAEIPGIMAALSGPNGEATWIEANDQDGGPTDESAQMMAPPLLATGLFPADQEYEGAEDRSMVMGWANPVTKRIEVISPHFDLGSDGRFTEAALRDIAASMSALGLSGGTDIRSDGTWRHPDTLDLVPTLANPLQWVGWGSSTMDGLHSSLTTLAAAWGAAFYGGGRGGELNDQILARMGAVPLTLSAVTIPASGPVAVAANIGDGYAGPATYSGYLALAGGAQLAGTLGNDGSGGRIFTRALAGDAVTIPNGTPFVPDAARLYRDSTVLLNLGKNNLNDGYALESIVRGNRIAYAWLSPLVKRVLVIGHPPKRDDTAGSEGMLLYQAVRDYEMARYRQDYIDVGGYLFSELIWSHLGWIKTETDIAELAAGKLPSRFFADYLHLQPSVRSAIVTYLIKPRMIALGWYGA